MNTVLTRRHRDKNQEKRSTERREKKGMIKENRTNIRRRGVVSYCDRCTGMDFKMETSKYYYSSGEQRTYLISTQINRKIGQVNVILRKEREQRLSR